jgi:hypothetical protein
MAVNKMAGNRRELTDYTSGLFYFLFSSRQENLHDQMGADVHQDHPKLAEQRGDGKSA